MKSSWKVAFVMGWMFALWNAAAAQAQSWEITTLVDPPEAGVIFCDPNPVPDGANSVCTGEVNPGWTFAGWSGACSGFGACVLTNVTEEKTVTASFTQPVFNIAVDAPASAQSGGSFAVRTIYSVSQVASQQTVVWTHYETTLDEDLGQVPVPLILDSATNGGQFTASAITVNGTAVPAHSVYWNLGNVAAGGTYPLNATWRIPGGELDGTRYDFQAQVRDNFSGVSRTSAIDATTASATRAPTAQIAGGAGWVLTGGIYHALPGGTVAFHAQAGNASSGATGRETLYQARAWVPLAPLCALAALSDADCVAQVSGLDQGGVADVAFDADGDGPLAAEPAVVWPLGTLAVGAQRSLPFSFPLAAQLAVGTQFTLQTKVDAARGAGTSASQVFRIADDTPAFGFVLGEKIDGVAAVSSGDDLPGQFIAAGQAQSLLLALGNNGLSEVRDALFWTRVPEHMSVLSAALPPAAGGRVFWSEHGEFADPVTPPDFDLTHAIGHFDLPEDIDIDANDYWHAADVDALPTDGSVRWLAFYLPRLAAASAPVDGVPVNVLAEIVWRAPADTPGTFCAANEQFTASGGVRVFAKGTQSQPDVALAVPLSAQNDEIVRIAHFRPQVQLSASGANSAIPGGAAATVNFSLANQGTVPLPTLTSLVLTLAIPSLNVNGVPMRPALASLNAPNGTPDLSDLEAGIVRIAYASLSPAASRSVALGLQYPAGILSGTVHTLAGSVVADQSFCVPAQASATRPVLVNSSPLLQVHNGAELETAEPAGELTFTTRYLNTGSAPSTQTHAFGPVPARTAFVRAELPAGRRLLCSSALPPALPADLTFDNLASFTATTFAQQFVSGIETVGEWTCASPPTWIALALDDQNLVPPLLATGTDETARLVFVNDDTHEGQPGSAPGTLLRHRFAIGASGLPNALGEDAHTMVFQGARPQVQSALGDDAGGVLNITRDVDDNEAATLASGVDFSLALRLANTGEVAVHDALHFLRVPDGLELRGVAAPATGERVFYSTSAGFGNAASPPPVDVSASIGTTALPEDIDAGANTHWEPFDPAAPPAFSGVRWLAFYRSTLAAESDSTALATLRRSALACSTSTSNFVSPVHVYAYTPTQGAHAGEEIAIPPQPLADTDSEPVRFFDDITPNLSLSAQDAGETEQGGEPVSFVFTVANAGSATVENASLTLDWPQVTVAGEAVDPVFVAAGASAGTVDTGQLASRRVIVALPPLAPAGSVTAQVTLRYAQGTVSGSHGVTGSLQAPDIGCGGDSDVGLSQVWVHGEVPPSPLNLTLEADQETLPSGGELSFTAHVGAAQDAEIWNAYAYAPVPEHAVFLGAMLPQGRYLYCTSDAITVGVDDPEALFSGLWASSVELGEPADDYNEPGEHLWTCPGGEATTAFLVYLPQEGVWQLPPGEAFQWRLLLRNDEVRDEPDLDQQDSPPGTPITLQLATYFYGCDDFCTDHFGTSNPASSQIQDDTPPDHAITTSAQPPAGGAVSCDPNPVPHGGSAICGFQASSGYSFTGWSGACSGTGVCALENVTEDVSVTANFVLDSYAIATAANPPEGGSVTCSPNPVPHGDDATCSFKAATGYSFTGWSGACSGTGACVLANVTEEKSVTASFTRNSYAIATTADPPDGGDLLCDPNPVPHGEDSLCEPLANPGFVFTGWSGDCSGRVCVLENVSGPRAVTARFAPPAIFRDGFEQDD